MAGVKLGEVGRLPGGNDMGEPGDVASAAQHLQNIRQQGANYRGQQIYNDPTTHAGREAQAAWLKNNPIPKQGGNVNYGGMSYGNKLQADTQRAVDLGNPGAHAQRRLGLIDENGYKPNTPGVNSRDTRSESAQHSQNNQAMADIKAQQATAKANGETYQPKGVNTINPTKSTDISGDRRRTEKANGWAKGSMDQGGEHYADNGTRTAQLVKQNGPDGIPQKPLAAPSPAPVAKTTPAPTGYQWKSKEAEKMYNDSVNKPNSGYNGNVNMGGGSLGGASAQRPQISSLSPDENNALTNFQTQNNARMKAEGSTRPPDDYTKLSPGEQKYVHDFNLERGNIPRPGRPPTGQVPNPRNPNKDMNDRPMLPKSQGATQDQENSNPSSDYINTDNFNISPADFGDMRDPKYADKVNKGTKHLNFTGGRHPEPVPTKPIMEYQGSPQELEPLVRGEQGSLENILKPKNPGVPIPPPPGTNNPTLDNLFRKSNPPSPSRPTPPPSNGLKGSTTGKATPKPPTKPYSLSDEPHYKFPTVEDMENATPVGPRPDRITTPKFNEGITFQSPLLQEFNTPKPVDGVDKLPSIKKSSPITDTIKASNNPVPVVDAPVPNQVGKKKILPKLLPRLRGFR